MHKKLLAAAVAGAFVAPAAVLAQSSTVNIYGAANYEYGVADQGPGRPKVDYPDTPGSSIGFRGEEKLGGNLSAWFQCESSADIRGIDQRGWCTRNSAVGIKGAFGNVFFGRWDTPFKRAMNVGTVGAEETGILGMSFMAFGGSGGSQAWLNSGESVASGESMQRQRFKRREVGLSYYESPSFGGFQVLAAISSGVGAADASHIAGAGPSGATDGTQNAAARIWSIGGVYSAGPLAIGVGYEKHVNFGTFNDSAISAALTGTTGFSGGDLDDRGWGASIAYTFGGRIKVGGTYLDRKWQTSSSAHTTKRSSTLGVEWAIAGPHSLEAQWVHSWDTKGTGSSIGGNGGATNNFGSLGHNNDTGGEAWSIAYRYSFSKRTSIKLGYVRVDNDANTNVVRIGNTAGFCSGSASSGSFCGAGRGAPTGQNVDGYAFKLFHRF